MKHLVLLGDRNPDFLTHRELESTLALLPGDVSVEWVATDSPDAASVNEADGLWVIPGSPYRNDEVVYSAIQSARITGQPFLGTCGGFQYAVVEFARNVAKIVTAQHAETAAGPDDLVVDRLACSLVGEERTICPVPGTQFASITGPQPFTGFHWCNYGLSPAWLEALASHGLVVAATAPDAGVEAIELAEHPFFVATLFQPQVGCAAAGKLHPLIAAFTDAIRSPINLRA
ncbi:MAG: gamma-glutamyl-gamma-aminobutyrate hydrolase family protein [Bryobacteraceae bacterium]|nr:gamma-glutamyl-gamma-aminobutyrate hydrolase family protein [Bryobacteraceae bacterium]